MSNWERTERKPSQEPDDPVERNCLTCGRKFKSRHRTKEWVCKKCKDTTTWKAGENVMYGTTSRWVRRTAGAS